MSCNWIHYVNSCISIISKCCQSRRWTFLVSCFLDGVMINGWFVIQMKHLVLCMLVEFEYSWQAADASVETQFKISAWFGFSLSLSCRYVCDESVCLPFCSESSVILSGDTQRDDWWTRRLSKPIQTRHGLSVCWEKTRAAVDLRKEI